MVWCRAKDHDDDDDDGDGDGNEYKKAERILSFSIFSFLFPFQGGIYSMVHKVEKESAVLARFG
jgi:hypothetical protein